MVRLLQTALYPALSDPLVVDSCQKKPIAGAQSIFGEIDLDRRSLAQVAVQIHFGSGTEPKIHFDLQSTYIHVGFTARAPGHRSFVLAPNSKKRDDLVSHDQATGDFYALGSAAQVAHGSRLGEADSKDPYVLMQFRNLVLDKDELKRCKKDLPEVSKRVHGAEQDLSLLIDAKKTTFLREGDEVGYFSPLREMSEESWTETTVTSITNCQNDKDKNITLADHFSINGAAVSVGLQVLNDPLRQEAPALLKKCKLSGPQVNHIIIISVLHKRTATRTNGN